MNFLIPAQAEVLGQVTEMIDPENVFMGFEREFRMQPIAGAYKSREPDIDDYCYVLDISRSILGDAAEPKPAGKGILVDPDDYADLQLLPDNRYAFGGPWQITFAAQPMVDILPLEPKYSLVFLKLPQLLSA